METTNTTEEQLSEVLDNILGLLLLEGSYEVEETDDNFSVLIETKDAGRLIGARGESLEGLQLVVNQIMSLKQKTGEFKRVILDVAGWRKQKEEELKSEAKRWGKQVLDSGKQLELEPMSSWQRRVIHMAISELKGLLSESTGEGRDRHIVIKLKGDA
ncbi:KH domain-containing protein [Candidatus Daviesbacteria bacterium]|nr:KH domain-containing protein [Candidatus Daviesbacteria bacterium]